MANMSLLHSTRKLEMERVYYIRENPPVSMPPMLTVHRDHKNTIMHVYSVRVMTHVIALKGEIWPGDILV